MPLPDGLAIVASLHLPAFLSSGFAPATPPPGLLDSITYSVEAERLYITLPPGISDEFGEQLVGGEYKQQPVVGWKDGIDTRTGDYVGFWGSDPYVPGNHPLAEAAADERTVRTNWLSAEEEAADAQDRGEVVLQEAQPL